MEADDDFVDRDEMCRIIGGRQTPIHPATLYRHVNAGRVHAPVKVGGLSRWIRSRAYADRQRMIEGAAERDSKAAA